MKKVIRIEGMSCGHCVARVQKALGTVAGITAAQVDLASNSATVEADGVSDDALRAVVEDAGYDVVSISEA